MVGRATSHLATTSGIVPFQWFPTGSTKGCSPLCKTRAQGGSGGTA